MPLPILKSAPVVMSFVIIETNHVNLFQFLKIFLYKITKLMYPMQLYVNWTIKPNIIVIIMTKFCLWSIVLLWHYHTSCGQWTFQVFQGLASGEDVSYTCINKICIDVPYLRMGIGDCLHLVTQWIRNSVSGSRWSFWKIKKYLA